MTDYEDKLFSELSTKTREVESDLKKVERYIYELETEYINSTAASGNIMRGWDHIFTSKPKISNSSQFQNLNKKQRISNLERVFSSTSAGWQNEDCKLNIQHFRCQSKSEHEFSEFY